MYTFRKIGEGILKASVIFLLFIVIFENRLHIPSWLQVVGRMHPMFLHFPIVLLLLSFFTFWLPEKVQNKEWFNILRLTASLSAVVTAIMGILLSLEDGRSGSTLQLHKWSGVSIAVLSFLFYAFHRFFSPKAIGRPFTVIASACIVIAGHFGASLTHGENYLLAPVTSEEKKLVSIDQAIAYTDVIKPVFEQKCYSCHGAGSMKGGLALDDSAGIMYGGKTGPLFVAGRPDSSLLIHRILLPQDDKKHMPPISKPALAEDEIALLKAWIKTGGLMNKRINELPKQDSFRIVAAKFLGPSENDLHQAVFDFPAADDKKINALNNNYRVIEPQGVGSPALSVHFYGKNAYSKKSLEELLPLKQQIIQLSVARMPVKDDDVTIIKQMTNLRDLNLDYTDITSKGLEQLMGLKKLQEVALSGTAIDQKSLEKIVTLPALTSVYVWNTVIDSVGIVSVRNRFKKVKIETGFKDDGDMLPLTPPMIQNATGIFEKDTQVVIKHPFKGVDIRYTLDGTEPDSVKSFEYRKPIPIATYTKLTARAFKKGWYGSVPAEAIYIKRGIKPDTIILETSPDPKYKGVGSLLSDGDIGDTNFGNGQWLGYRKGKATFNVLFKREISIQSVFLSMLKSTSQYVFPPHKIEIWGGTEKTHLKLLGKADPTIPEKDEAASLLPLEIKFPQATVNYLKIIAEPLPKLPEWSKEKKEKPWILISEIVVN